MKLLQTYNANSFEPKDYIVRKVVRCVILDENENKVLLFGGIFVGGGVEEDETDEEAIIREALEEVGAKVEILKPLGEIVSYRDYLKKKYVTHGYFCKYIETISQPTTLDTDEKNAKAEWADIDETLARLQKEIDVLIKEGEEYHGGELYQSKLHNRQITLLLLKEALL